MSDPAPPARARVVIVGGGIIGCSIAYHLVRRGWSDVVLLERKTLTSGTTWHAAGLITQARPTPGMRRMVHDSLEVFAELEAQTGVGYRDTGTIHLAATVDRWDELLRQAAAMRVDGITTQALTPEDVQTHFPLLNPDGLIGGVYYPRDGRGNASDTTMALAKAARRGGATILERTEATAVALANGRVTGVRTPAGLIEAEYVVNATGMWGRQFGASHGVSLPLQALEHYYLVTDDVPGLGNGWPTLKSSDDCAYIKDEAGKLMVGFFEPGSAPWKPDGIPSDVEYVSLPGDWEHLTPFFEKVVTRIPAIADIGVRLFFCGPESFTPDGVFHLGEVAELRNYFAAVGFNSIGFLSGPGAGRFLADWIVDGHAPYDLREADPRRSLPFQRNRRYLERRVTETLDLSYSIHWPFEQRQSARGVRRTPLHDRVANAGAVFGEVAGWERANWYATRGEKPRYEYSFGRQNWFDSSAEEHHAVRTGVGLFDLSSFGKLTVQGRDAPRLLQRLCANDIDIDIDTVVYSLMLNPRGGIEADVTVTRTGEHEFLVLTAASSARRDAHWIASHILDNEHAIVSDATNSMAMLAVMGPRSRQLMAKVTDADLTADGFPLRASREIGVGFGIARATRMSYVGELGWELLIPTEQAVHCYDTLLDAGVDIGLRHAGYHALDSLRLEKGRRSWGHDIGPDDTPLQAGLDATVDWDKPGGFIGREALLPQRDRQVRRTLVQLTVRDPQVMVHHGEPVFRDSRLVGSVTSGAYGHSLGTSVCLAYVSDAPRRQEPAQLGCYRIGVGDDTVDADLHLRPPTLGPTRP